jgi:hypothetical protein
MSIGFSHLGKCVDYNVLLTDAFGRRNYKRHANTHVLHIKLCLRSEDTFVIACVANLMEVKVLYVQQDLRYEISSYWRFNV